MRVRRDSDELLLPGDDVEEEDIFHYNHTRGSGGRGREGGALLAMIPSFFRPLIPDFAGTQPTTSERMPLDSQSTTHAIDQRKKSGKDECDEAHEYKSKDGGLGSGKTNGLHWITAAAFIVADMAGGGVVAMPIALLKVLASPLIERPAAAWLEAMNLIVLAAICCIGGFYGTIAIAVICSAFCYTAHLLGENWMTMCKRWPKQYQNDHCRKPYPEMAFRSMGEGARRFTSCTLNVMLFGVAIVYLLLSSKIISDFLASAFNVRISPCAMLLVVAALLLPVTMLKSPQDFWLAVVTAMLTTAFSVILILIGTAMDYEFCAPVVDFPSFKFDNLLLSLGIFMFSFGGHGVFPTIQHDMKHPKHFTRSSVAAFIVVFLMYIPITVLGYLVYGDSLKDSIIMSIQSPFIHQAANLFIAVHCILTLTIVINPLNQEVEHQLRVPHHFGWKRVLIRSIVMLLVVFSAESVPSFGPILNLIGGTTVALTSAVMPCLFYLYLHADPLLIENKVGVANGKTKKRSGFSKSRTTTFKQVLRGTPLLVLFINFLVIALAVICGIATTQSAVVEIATSSFSTPCYLSTPSNARISTVQTLHCCGRYQNVSRLGDSSSCSSAIA